MGVGDRGCCSLEDAADAEQAANRLDIPFYVLDLADDFRRQVIARFVAEYQRGATPNPCIDCNRFIKFERLFLRAEQLGMDCVATGHYARIAKEGGRFLLKKASDLGKDQSYVLYAMTQDQLRRTEFPLGELQKTEVRAIAAANGFSNADKPDSQDICFVRDGKYADFICRYTGSDCEAGNFIDTEGQILGRHKGHIRYTIGQRKGLEIALGKPMYVKEKNPADNTVTLCEEGGLYTRDFCAGDFNWIPFDKPEGMIRVKAKVRYSQQEHPATAQAADDGSVRIKFDEPQRAIAKGQAVVLYDGDVVVGGGTIK